MGRGLLDRAGLPQRLLQQRDHDRIHEVGQAGGFVVDGVSVAETSPDELVVGDSTPHDTRGADADACVQMYLVKMREPNEAMAVADAMAPG